MVLNQRAFWIDPYEFGEEEEEEEKRENSLGETLVNQEKKKKKIERIVQELIKKEEGVKEGRRYRELLRKNQRLIINYKSK